jgi:glycosyltransferase involved in cell wall biosynthesis
MKTKVALHRFISDPSLKQRDGVNLAHTEINRILDGNCCHELVVEFHDLDQLLRDDALAKSTLQDVDCVLCNVGPHAHYYHAMRHRLGLGFRIVRDIKTALWSSYLLQESLCAPYLRPGDALLATSKYSRALTRRLFPHLTTHPILLFEPVLSQPEAKAEPTGSNRKPDRPITLGHIGRLSEDKNFPQMVDLLITLNRQAPGQFRLLACGAVHSQSCDPKKIAARVQAECGRPDLFCYLPPVAHDDVLPLMSGFDYFLFFSTSNLEVLGRVLIEAARANVPILAANHAAAAELLDPSSLIDVRYAVDQSFYTHFDAPLGTVDIDTAARRIIERTRPLPPPEPQVNHLECLTRILSGCAPEDASGRPEELDPKPAHFLAQLRWSGLPEHSGSIETDALIAKLQDWFCALNGKRSADFAERLRTLEELSSFPERTRKFIQASHSTRCDFTNLGGIDIELCNVADFHPRFWVHQG